MINRYKQLNGIALAYLGDAVYELYIREYLISKGYSKPSYLQHLSTHFVSAKAQAYLISEMNKNNLLNEEEKFYFKKGRNSKSYTKAKNTDVMTYRISTGFEAILGYLKLANKNKRLSYLISWCIKCIVKKDGCID